MHKKTEGLNLVFFYYKKLKWLSKTVDFNKTKIYTISGLIKLKGILTLLKKEDLPNWLIHLEIEDIVFIKKLVLASGSLKELAKEYEITYPTIRIRMDKLIEKIKLYDKAEVDPYIETIKLLALNDKIDLDTTKILIDEYRRTKK